MNVSNSRGPNYTTQVNNLPSTANVNGTSGAEASVTRRTRGSARERFQTNYNDSATVSEIINAKIADANNIPVKKTNITVKPTFTSMVNSNEKLEIENKTSKNSTLKQSKNIDINQDKLSFEREKIKSSKANRELAQILKKPIERDNFFRVHENGEVLRQVSSTDNLKNQSNLVYVDRGPYAEKVYSGTSQTIAKNPKLFDRNDNEIETKNLKHRTVSDKYFNQFLERSIDRLINQEKVKPIHSKEKSDIKEKIKIEERNRVNFFSNTNDKLLEDLLKNHEKYEEHHRLELKNNEEFKIIENAVEKRIINKNRSKKKL